MPATFQIFQNVTHPCASVAYVDNRSVNQRPARGTHVDSISYYTYDLADCNRNMYTMQQRKAEIALTGNSSYDVDTWLSRLMISANEIADQIMIDSAMDNALRANYKAFDERFGVPIPQAELMASHYGSFGHKIVGMSPRTSQCVPYATRYKKNSLHRTEVTLSGASHLSPISDDSSSDEEKQPVPEKTPSSEQLLVSSFYPICRDEKINRGSPNACVVTAAF
jgi:hypothetical protein